MCTTVPPKALALSGVEPIVREDFRAGIEPIQHLIAADPQEARAILEQRENKRTRQAVSSCLRFVHEQLELIAVVAIQPVLGSEPHEPQVVLNDLSHPRLGKAVRGGDVSKPQPACNDDRQMDDVRRDSRLRRTMTRLLRLSIGAA
jgi:hypothetical protein